jgi:hypothetical protein
MKRLGLSIAIAAALGLSACGGSSSSSSSSGATASTVSGTASKGIIIGGLVSAYLFDASGNPETTALVTAITNENGEYSLTIPAAHVGKPLYIDINNNNAAGDAATMKCDISGGCGSDIEFGEAYTLADDFSLGAVLPEAGGAVSVNLTPFTTAAAKKALDDIEVVGGGSGVASLISNANSSVANTLNGILGSTLASVNDIPIIDLTNPVAVAAAIAAGDTDDVKVAALSAAIVSAVQADDDALSIEEAIAEFTDDLSENALVGNASDDSVTDVAEILAEVEDVLLEVSEAATEAGTASDALTELTAEIEEIKDDAEAEDPDEEVDDTPSPTAGSANLDKVKAFVEELRELGTVIDGKTLKEDGETIETILEGFDMQIDAADTVTSDDAELAMEALVRAVSAIVDVYDANFDTETGLPTEESELTTFPATISSEEEALAVEINLSAGVYSFSVVDEAVIAELEESSDSIQIAAVAIKETPTASVNITVTLNALTIVEVENDGTTEGGVYSEDGTVDANVDLNITGTVSTNTIDLTVTNGIVKGELDVVWEGVDTESEKTSVETDDATFELNGFEFDLDVVLSQKTSENIPDPLTFTGGFEFTVSNLDFIEDEEETFGQSENGPDELDQYTYSLDVVGLDITGSFANTTGESFDMAFSINADASNVPSLIETFENQDKTDSTGGETEANFVAADASLTFDANLDGFTDSVTFSFDVERTGYDDVDASVSISYPGRTIMIEATGDNLDSDDETGLASLTLTNNDGVVMAVNADESIVNEDDEITGTMTVEGDTTIYAELANVNGVDIIRYSDGSFVSAF